MYQGDPLSVVLFNTVINTMVDTIKTRPDLGYHLTSTQSVNLLQYADDTCLVADSPSSCQQLLHLVDGWLSWSGMRAKVSKCHSLALKASVAKVVDPHLHISNEQIPFASEPVKFLGRMFESPPNTTKARENISSQLQRMLHSIDSCPLTRSQKLKLYRAGVCPRLVWLLTIEDLPLSWVEKKLDAISTFYVKKWVGLAKSANPALLYLPQKMGGLNLPLVSVFFKRLQVTKQSQLLTSPDPCVRLLAEKALQKDLTRTRSKFSPRVVVRELMVANPDFTRKSLSKGAKVLVEEESLEEQHDRLLSQEKEGQMLRCASSDAASLWGKALTRLSDEAKKFAVNGAVDTLPHNANLHLWKRRGDDKCPLCGERQTLIHVLNVCPVALQSRRFNHRHDAVLNKIVATISNHIPPSAEITSDLHDYNFPQHIVPTTLKPDIVWWDDNLRQLRLAELTVCFETTFDGAAERKRAKYIELQRRAQSVGYHTVLITLEVGSRGIVNNQGFSRLQEELKIPEKEFSTMLQAITLETIVQSHQIWCLRNHPP